MGTSSVRNDGVKPNAQTTPSGHVAPSANKGKLTPSAAGTPQLAGVGHPGKPVVTSQNLQAAGTAMAPLQSGSKLSVRKEFDAESKKLTAPLFMALEDTRITAIDHFDRQHRLPAYATFKLVRDGNQTKDVTHNDHYSTVAQQRMRNTATMRGEKHIAEGKSELEKLLPKDSPFRRLMEPATGSIRDVKTGLNADLTFRHGPPPVYRLVFPGTGLVDTTGVQTGVNIRQFLGIGGVPAAYQDALELAKKIQDQIQKHNPDAKLELGGHSLGGGIATYVGLRLGVKAVGFNSVMLGPACMEELRKTNCLTPDRLANVHQVRIEGDAVSSRKANKLLVGLTSFGLLFPSRVPRLLGQVHQISETNAAHPKCGAVERHRPDAFYAAYDRKKPAR